MLMPSGDTKESRGKFNQEATASLQRHREDVAHRKQIASGAALDFKQRQKQAANAVRNKKKTA